MTPLQRTWMIRWLLVFFAATLVFCGFAFGATEKLRNTWIYFIGAFCFISSLYMWMVARSVLDPQDRSINGVLGAIVVKQLSSMLVILAYVFKFYGKDPLELAVCLSTYLVYTVIAVYFGYKLSK